MSKVRIEVVYANDMEIGDVPLWVIEESLKDERNDFSIWEMSGTAVLESVSIAPTK